jgi:hypothetical protein
MIRDYPEAGQLLGAALVILAIAVIAGAIFAVARQFMFSRRSGPTVIDEYLTRGAVYPGPAEAPCSTDSMPDSGSGGHGSHGGHGSYGGHS